MSISDDIRFEKALEFELPHECEYDHHGNVIVEYPDGHPTKYGMEQPDVDWGNKHIDGFSRDSVKNLTHDEAAQLYYYKYWLPLKCDKLPDGYAETVFDIGVNNGNHEAAILLQRAVGAKQDGIIGPKTLAAVDAAGKQGLSDLISVRRQLYYNIVDAHPQLKHDLSGWLNRNNDLAKFVGVV